MSFLTRNIVCQESTMHGVSDFLRYTDSSGAVLVVLVLRIIFIPTDRSPPCRSA